LFGGGFMTCEYFHKKVKARQISLLVVLWKFSKSFDNAQIFCSTINWQVLMAKSRTGFAQQ
jgi:hypothetical protein